MVLSHVFKVALAAGRRLLACSSKRVVLKWYPLLSTFWLLSPDSLRCAEPFPSFARVPKGFLFSLCA